MIIYVCILKLLDGSDRLEFQVTDTMARSLYSKIMNRILSLPPIVIALAIQFLVYFSLVAFQPIIQENLGYPLPLFWLMSVQGVVSAAVTFLVRLSYWWIALQLVTPPLLVLGLALNIPLWIFPVLLIVLVLVFWNVAINRVPLYLTNKLTVDRLHDLLPKRDGLKVVDLGSGLSGTIRRLALRRPQQNFEGFETAPIPFCLSWFLNKVAGCSNIILHFRSFWAIDLSEYDVVYCFLSPVPMSDLYEKARLEMKPGSLFISNSFTVPDHRPSRTVTVKDGRKTKLMIWKI